MIRPSLVTALLAVALGAGCTCAGDPSPAPDARQAAPPATPNVLVIVWDTVRADHLSLYGYERETTPRVAALARDAVVYERAVSPAMWTLPSHASLFTGLPESAHGASSQHKWLDGRFVTMAEWFGERGYDTYLFSANPYLQDHTNVGQGFDVREFPWSRPWKAKARRATMSKVLPQDASNHLGPRWKPSKYASGRGNDRVKDAGPVAAEALFTWIDGRPADAPWLAVLNYMEAHGPRIPSLAARRALFGDREIAQQLAFDQSYGWMLAYMVQKHEFTPEELQLIVDVYDATLRDLDTVTADLLEALDARGELDDTIVVLTSDHGEHLGEHHLVGHKFSVYNPLVRVPLMIRYPKRLPPGRVEQVVSNLSVFATVADLAGIEPPRDTLSGSLVDLDALDGRAFSELVHATPTALKRMSKLHPDLAWEPFLRTYASVETEDSKCIVASDGGRELYAMPDDPLETADLAAAEPERTDAVCGLIDAWKATFPAYDPSLADAGEGPRREFDDETKARLAALGYLEEEVTSDSDAPAEGWE